MDPSDRGFDQDRKMGTEMKFEEIGEISPETLLADGFEKALIGVAEQGGVRKVLAVYDKSKCIEILMDRNNWSEEEAIEFFDFNVIGGYIGEYTPIFMEKIE